MALNTSHIGTPVAIIKNSKKYAKTVFSVSPDDEKNGFNSFDIVDNGIFQVIPNPDKERSTVYIAGSAGSGKSYWTARYIEEYKKQNSDNPVYLITEANDPDPAFEKLDLKKVNLDGILEDPIDYNEFSDCCCVFDDVDALTGKLYKYVYLLRDKLLKNSRKKRVSVVSTSHTFTNRDLSAVLNESEVIVFFMSNYNRSLKYLLESYIGLNKEGINTLRKTRSRWCSFLKTYPNVIIQEKKIQTINHLQD